MRKAGKERSRERRGQRALLQAQHLSVPCRGTDEEHNVSTYYETALEVAIFHAGYLRS